jgi:hypothetical protein
MCNFFIYAKYLIVIYIPSIIILEVPLYIKKIDPKTHRTIWSNLNAGEKRNFWRAINFTKLFKGCKLVEISLVLQMEFFISNTFKPT